MNRQTKKNPSARQRWGSTTAASGKSFSTSKPTAVRRGWQGHRMPNDWRERLPTPETYYRVRVEKLSPQHINGWAQGRCPFHDDGTASLSVHLGNPRGGWRCFAGCGSGDLLAFHMRLTGLAFAEAVRDLVGGAR